MPSCFPIARVQEALALPSGDEQGQVAEAHRRTTLAMTDLRSTLRDEHHCLLQVSRPMHCLPAVAVLSYATASSMVVGCTHLVDSMG